MKTFHCDICKPQHSGYICCTGSVPNSCFLPLLF